MQAILDETAGAKRVVLGGGLDTSGVSAIELTFTAMVVPAGLPTIVDLAAVSFLASLGVRMFIGTARAVARKGGRLVFYNAVPAVTEIIDTMGLGEIIDVTATEAEALALVQG